MRHLLAFACATALAVVATTAVADDDGRTNATAAPALARRRLRKHKTGRASSHGAASALVDEISESRDQAAAETDLVYRKDATFSCWREAAPLAARRTPHDPAKTAVRCYNATDRQLSECYAAHAPVPTRGVPHMLRRSWERAGRLVPDGDNGGCPCCARLAQPPPELCDLDDLTIKRYFLAAAAQVSVTDARYGLDEWLAHHRREGFERFYLHVTDDVRMAGKDEPLFRAALAKLARHKHVALTYADPSMAPPPPPPPPGRRLSVSKKDKRDRAARKAERAAARVDSAPSVAPKDSAATTPPPTKPHNKEAEGKEKTAPSPPNGGGGAVVAADTKGKGSKGKGEENDKKGKAAPASSSPKPHKATDAKDTEKKGKEPNSAPDIGAGATPPSLVSKAKKHAAEATKSSHAHPPPPPGKPSSANKPKPQPKTAAQFSTAASTPAVGVGTTSPSLVAAAAKAKKKQAKSKEDALVGKAAASGSSKRTAAASKGAFKSAPAASNKQEQPADAPEKAPAEEAVDFRPPRPQPPPGSPWFVSVLPVAADEAEWLAMLSVDEFMWAPHLKTVAASIRKLTQSEPMAGAIAVPTLAFSDPQHVHPRRPHCTLRSYTVREPLGDPAPSRPIVRPSAVVGSARSTPLMIGSWHGAHPREPQVCRPFVGIDADGAARGAKEAVPRGTVRAPSGGDHAGFDIRVNHYAGTREYHGQRLSCFGADAIRAQLAASDAAAVRDEALLTKHALYGGKGPQQCWWLSGKEVERELSGDAARCVCAAPDTPLSPGVPCDPDAGPLGPSPGQAAGTEPPAVLPARGVAPVLPPPPPTPPVVVQKKNHKKAPIDRYAETLQRLPPAPVAVPVPVVPVPVAPVPVPVPVVPVPAPVAPPSPTLFPTGGPDGRAAAPAPTLTPPPAPAPAVAAAAVQSKRARKREAMLAAAHAGIASMSGDLVDGQELTSKPWELGGAAPLASAADEEHALHKALKRRRKADADVSASAPVPIDDPGGLDLVADAGGPVLGLGP